MISIQKILLSVFVLSVLASASFAATDTVMLVGGMTSVDSATAAAAARTGVPVLVLDSGTLNDQTRSAIAELSPTTIVLVGGPVVIKPEVQTELAKSYNVIRLWGMERTGTAIEVAKYFWPEGAECAVLVADTKNSNLDSKRESAASAFAAHFNCTMVPIPEGTLPAEVLNMITDLNVSNVWYVGRASMPGLREALRMQNVSEITGDDNSLESQIANRTVSRSGKLVIVATPDWKAAVALSAEPNDNSVVWHVSDAANLTDVMAFIKSHNITTVRVVGIPSIANQIADNLAANNITVTKVTGDNAGEISRAIIKDARNDWNRIRNLYNNMVVKIKADIRTRLLNQLDKADTVLDNAEAEANSIANADISSYLAAVNSSKQMIADARTSLQNGNVDLALKQLTQALSNIRELRLERSKALGIDVSGDLSSEEENVNQSQANASNQIGMMNGLVNQIRTRCNNSDAFANLSSKIETLRTGIQDARENGDYSNLAELSKQAKQLGEFVKNVAAVCSAKGRVLPFLVGSVERRGISGRPTG